MNDSAFSDFKVDETAKKDAEQGNQIVEPLTGSAVLVEPKAEAKAPTNGFPIGYGPNAHMTKIEKPKKPKLGERLKYARKKMTKKQKILAISIPAATAVLVGGFIVLASVTGMFKIDYSTMYQSAKELKGEMQKLRSDGSCEKVIDYLDNQYTTMKVYSSYVEGCKTVGEGVTAGVINAVGNTEGVLKDDEVRQKYNAFKIVMDASKDGNKRTNETLDIYTVWHSWVIAESSGNSSHNDWRWTEADLKNAAEILTSSEVPEFKKYGEEWLAKKKAAAEVTNAYFNHALNTAQSLKELYDQMIQAQTEFNDWKKNNAINVSELYPLEMVDMNKLYNKFEQMYDYMREVYQNNYNPKAGGCKELVGSVICD